MIRQAHGQVLPGKQHPEYNLAVKIVQGREPQLTAEGDHKREESKDKHAANPAPSFSPWEGWWSSSWWDNPSWKWTENRPQQLLARFEGVSGEPPKGGDQSRGENTLTAHTSVHFSSRTCHLSSFRSHVDLGLSHSFSAPIN